MAAKRMKARQRRQQIMAVAQRLFASRGYSLTTTAAIAAAAGVTEPILYRHFAGKGDLFLQLLGVISRQIIAGLGELAERSAGPFEQLDAVVTGYLKLPDRLAEPFAIIGRALAHLADGAGGAGPTVPDVRPVLARHYAACEKLLAGVIARAQAAGRLREDIDCRLAAWQVIHVALGWRLARNVQPEALRRKQSLPRSAGMLLGGLLKTG